MWYIPFLSFFFFLTVSEEFYYDSFELLVWEILSVFIPVYCKTEMVFCSILRETMVSSFMLLIVFLFPFPKNFQICGLSLQAAFFFMLILASKFVGRKALGSVSPDPAALAVSLGCVSCPTGSPWSCAVE